MLTSTLVWGLWIVGGGMTSGGWYLAQPSLVAYFFTIEECQRVGKMVQQLYNPSVGRPHQPWQCIQANYVISK